MFLKKQKQTSRIEIPMRLPSLNEYTAKCRIQRGTWNAGNDLKRKTQDALFVYLIGLPRYRKPIRIHFLWHEKNQKRDLDNIAFAKKFILDAMQEVGIIPNDNPRYIKGFTDTPCYDGKYAVEMIIEEA